MYVASCYIHKSLYVCILLCIDSVLSLLCAGSESEDDPTDEEAA